MNIHSYLLERLPSTLLKLPRTTKRAIAISVDVIICLATTWLAFYLRLGEPTDVSITWRSMMLSTCISIPVFMLLGVYETIFRYAGKGVISIIGKSCLVYALLYAGIVMTIGLEETPRTIGLLQPMLYFFGVAMSRVLGQLWLTPTRANREKSNNSKAAVIYGSGKTGQQLANALYKQSNIRVEAFLDDDHQLHGNKTNGIPVFAPSELPTLIEAKKVSLILLAIPSLSQARKIEVLKHLTGHNVQIRVVPSLYELAAGNVTLADMHRLEIHDLLARDIVIPDTSLLIKKVTNRVVLVTGAGGSIGRELCVQILKLNPKKLVLLDANEYALYSAQEQLKTLIEKVAVTTEAELIPKLGSVQDKIFLKSVLSELRPDTIYHSAAYKHVPLVEQNIIESVKNNIFGTLNTVTQAIDLGVRDFILISTDKAVRPTNVMGATKRFAEMIIQALQNENKSRTMMSMVRFGNVLDSSGSVIPKFRNQIRAGGPMTVTHPEVNRYFMTIPEAAQLVIQSSSLAEGGDVFVLDMGQPVKIIDLARAILQLSGLTEKTASQPNGDIEIKITGLRPGEKLFEELLIGNNPQTTSHPKIKRAKELFQPWSHIEQQINILQAACERGDQEKILDILKSVIPEFEHNPNSTTETNSDKDNNVIDISQVSRNFKTH